MVSIQSFIVFVCTSLTFLATGETFFLYSNKKSSTERSALPVSAQYYRDTSPAIAGPMSWSPGQQYAFDGAGPVTVALPVAVPIQAQMAPMPTTLKGTVHNVQLVPCLCPVSKDIEPIPMPSSSSSSSYIVQSGPMQSTAT